MWVVWPRYMADATILNGNRVKWLVILHRKPSICDNLWCVKCNRKNSLNAKGFLKRTKWRLDITSKQHFRSNIIKHVSVLQISHTIRVYFCRYGRESFWDRIKYAPTFPGTRSLYVYTVPAFTVLPIFRGNRRTFGLWTQDLQKTHVVTAVEPSPPTTGYTVWFVWQLDSHKMWGVTPSLVHPVWVIWLTLTL